MSVMFLSGKCLTDFSLGIVGPERSRVRLNQPERLTACRHRGRSAPEEFKGEPGRACGLLPLRGVSSSVGDKANTQIIRYLDGEDKSCERTTRC